MTPALITETKPRDWIHVSEGTATIVFSYQGPHNVKFSDHVLRLRKVAHGSSHNMLLETNTKQSFVLLRNGDRPAERRRADQIDVRRSKGVLATDLIGGTSIAMEIKVVAKCHLSPVTVALKTATCRFRMHTSFKMEQGGFGTTYCPLDLFSRNQTGVRRALGALRAGWYESHGSLNNLRFFVEGRMTKPDDDLRESFISVLSQPLLDSPVLPLLSTLQRTLDILDIEGLSKLYTQTSPDCPYDGIGSSVPDPAVEEWEDFVKVYQSDYHSWDHTVLNPGHLRLYVIAYLLSATFKDCSIIIRPKSSQVGSFDATIIDTDVKSMNRLGKWEKLDMKIMEHYRSSGRQRRCIDGQRVK
ncbi:inositol-pentakisphosphate 2-kinase-domain-containing protein [Suillus spraguei]|nr:inositol-pentakisphosphate 2-kinase-domain-containing protein [Suillus spraguei]